MNKPLRNFKQWAVLTPDGGLYAASNTYTRWAAKERHESDMGTPWSVRQKMGDRVVRVVVTIVQKPKKKR